MKKASHKMKAIVLALSQLKELNSLKSPENGVQERHQCPAH